MRLMNHNWTSVWIVEEGVVESPRLLLKVVVVVVVVGGGGGGGGGGAN